MDGPEPVAVDVRVLLRRADVGVAEQLLHRAQIRATGQLVRGKTVSQHVRADLHLQSRASRVFLHQHP